MQYNHFMDDAKRRVYTPEQRARRAAKRAAYDAAYYAAHRIERIASSAAYYAAHRTERVSERAAYNAAYRAANRSWLWEYLLTHPCVDCSEADPLVLQFDHVTAKVASVADLIGHSLARIKAEIAKCQVRCANCHARMTHLRANSYRAWRAGYWGAPDAPDMP